MDNILLVQFPTSTLIFITTTTTTSSDLVWGVMSDRLSTDRDASDPNITTTYNHHSNASTNPKYHITYICTHTHTQHQDLMHTHKNILCTYHTVYLSNQCICNREEINRFYFQTQVNKLNITENVRNIHKMIKSEQNI